MKKTPIHSKTVINACHLFFNAINGVDLVDKITTKAMAQNVDSAIKEKVGVKKKNK
jgi:hypothetical protein